MTRRILTISLAICASLPLMAQGRMGGPGGGPPGGAGRPDGTGFLAGYLNLTDAQKTAAQAIFDAARAASEPVRGQLASANDSLHLAITGGKPDIELDTLSADIGKLQGQLTAIQAKAQSKFYALLTAEQKAKYNERGGMGPGFTGGMGPRGMMGRGARGQ